MFRQAKVLPHQHSPQNSTDNSKRSPIDQSTTILQSQNNSLPLAHRPSIPLPNHSRYHKCCNPLTTQDHPHQPTVSCLPFQLYPSTLASISRSRKEQWEALIQDTRSKNMERTERKVREEEEKARECTFSPAITPFALPNSHSQQVHLKLYNEAELRRSAQLLAEKQQLQKRQLEMENGQNKQYDASKWLILNSQKFDLQPLYKRLEKVIEEKRKNRKVIAEKEQNTNPFHPQLNQASKQLIAKKGMLKNVVDRLIDEYSKRENRISILRDSMEANINKQCTFSPAINNYMPPERQTAHQIHKECNLPHSFTPSINATSALMTQDRAHETTQERHFRMVNTPLIKKADRLSQIEAEAYAECCFNPEINQISRHIHSVGLKHHACQLKKMESPTYRPSINQASKLMSESKRAKSQENIKRKTKQKEEDYKQSLQYSQMKECTFKPRIKDNKSARTIANSHMTLHDVAGFQRFYQNRQKHNEKEKAKRMLQQRLFQLEKSYDLRMGKAKTNSKSGKQY